MGKQPMRFHIVDVVGEHCQSVDDGKKVYDLVFPEIKKGSTVELDFERVQALMTPFLNSCFARLLENFGMETVMERVVLRNLREDHLQRINEFISRVDAQQTLESDRATLEELFDEDGLTESPM